MGFIKRTTYDFKHTNSIIYLYKTLVLPLLTYCSTIWSPNQQTYIDKLKGIQRKLLRYLALKSGNPISYTDHDYSSLYTCFKLPSIYQIHFQADAVTAFKVIHQLSNSPDTLDLFTTREVHYNLRHLQPLSLASTSSNYIFFTGSQKLKRVWNKLPPVIRRLPNIRAFKSEIKKLNFKQLLSICS